MNRREILPVAGGLSTVVLGGCTGSEPPPGTSTRSSTATPTATPSSGDGPTGWERSFQDVPPRPAVGPLAYVGAGTTAYGLDPFSGENVWTRSFDKAPQFLSAHGNTVYVNAYEEGPEVGMDSPATVHANTQKPASRDGLSISTAGEVSSPVPMGWPS